MIYTIYNFCPYQTAQKIKKIFALCRKQKLKLVRFEEKQEEQKSFSGVDMFSTTYVWKERKLHRNCPYCKKVGLKKGSNITTTLEFA